MRRASVCAAVLFQSAVGFVHPRLGRAACRAAVTMAFDGPRQKLIEQQLTAALCFGRARATRSRSSTTVARRHVGGVARAFATRSLLNIYAGLTRARAVCVCARARNPLRRSPLVRCVARPRRSPRAPAELRVCRLRVVRRRQADRAPPHGHRDRRHLAGEGTALCSRARRHHSTAVRITAKTPRTVVSLARTSQKHRTRPTSSRARARCVCVCV